MGERQPWRQVKQTALPHGTVGIELSEIDEETGAVIVKAHVQRAAPLNLGSVTLWLNGGAEDEVLA